jgi:hypothetical protein
MVEKPKRILQKPNTKKYLITWSLDLAREDFEKISRQPEVLQKGLRYIRNTTRKNALTVYRIGSMDELTRFERLGRVSGFESKHPNGIAIAEAASIEEARKMIDVLVEGLGFGFGTVPVKNYLEYEIKPLIEITAGERQ